MRIDGIAVGDMVKASIGGRVVYGEVLEIRDGVVHFIPVSRAAGWRHAAAHQIVAHWRRAGRRGSPAEGVRAAPEPPEQLSLRLEPGPGDP
ncbi:MAG: hypothetical protein ACR2NR_01140 [Solirubrobacteraceae bacterium]